MLALSYDGPEKANSRTTSQLKLELFHELDTGPYSVDESIFDPRVDGASRRPTPCIGIEKKEGRKEGRSRGMPTAQLSGRAL